MVTRVSLELAANFSRQLVTDMSFGGLTSASLYFSMYFFGLNLEEYKMMQIMHKSLEIFPSEDSPVFIALVSFHLLTLLSLIDHYFYDWIFRIIDFFKHLMCTEMVHMPFMQFQYISDTVDPSIGFQQESILREETSIDYPSSVILGLEVRVREANEYLL